jgi:predicted alpha/beta-fold hydrolase
MRAPWWGADLQTLRNYLMPSVVDLTTASRRRLHFPMTDGSGDEISGLLHCPQSAIPDRAVPERTPLVVLIHGLTGSEESAYIRASTAYHLACGMRVLRLNLRSAGPTRPRCRLQYHAGRTEDLAAVLRALPASLTEVGVLLVGYSLGGNMVLKFLGEAATAPPVLAAAAVSAPIDLSATAQRMMDWRNRFYQRYLLARMKEECLAPGGELTEVERRAVLGAQTVWAFDDGYVAPHNGFAGAEDY